MRCFPFLFSLNFISKFSSSLPLTQRLRVYFFAENVRICWHTLNYVLKNRKCSHQYIHAAVMTTMLRTTTTIEVIAEAVEAAAAAAAPKANANEII